jgi:hypothetical protein
VDRLEWREYEMFVRAADQLREQANKNAQRT